MAFGTILIWMRPWPNDVKIALTALEFFLWLVLTLALLDQIVRPLQTLTNVVGALREEDYSFRARGAAPNDALGELAHGNQLAGRHPHRATHSNRSKPRRCCGAWWKKSTLRCSPSIPTTFCALVNAAGERLLQQPSARLLGKTATELELDACFEAPKRDAGSSAVFDAQRALDGAP